MSVLTNPASGAEGSAEAYIAAILSALGDQEPLPVLRETPARLRQLVEGRSLDELRRPEAPHKWAAVAVVQHLADSELIWGFRLRMIVAHDQPDLAGYDQDAWAARLRYSEVEIGNALQEFEVIRRANLRILEALSPEEWARSAVHSERGAERLDFMAKLYAGHDIVHVRQLERVLGIG